MLKAVGYTDDDLKRPLVGIANTWIEVIAVQHPPARLAAQVRKGSAPPRHAGRVQHHRGLRRHLDGDGGDEGVARQPRGVADSIELVARGHLFDAVVALAGCDKTIPGTAMALARLDLPSLVLYGGSIEPGRFRDRDVTIQDVFEAVGAHAAGKMTAADLHELEDRACPGPAPAAASSPPTPWRRRSSFWDLGVRERRRAGDRPAQERGRARDGAAVMELLRQDLRPSRILTRASFENAIASIAAPAGRPQRAAPSGPEPRGEGAAQDRRLRHDQRAYTAAR